MSIESPHFALTVSNTVHYFYFFPNWLEIEKQIRQLPLFKRLTIVKNMKETIRKNTLESFPKQESVGVI